jgi:hypothetical protein
VDEFNINNLKIIFFYYKRIMIAKYCKYSLPLKIDVNLDIFRIYLRLEIFDILSKPCLKVQIFKRIKIKSFKFIVIGSSSSIAYSDSIYLQKEKKLNTGKQVSRISYKVIEYLLILRRTIAKTISEQIEIEFRKFAITIIY